MLKQSSTVPLSSSMDSSTRSGNSPVIHQPARGIPGGEISTLFTHRPTQTVFFWGFPQTHAKGVSPPVDATVGRVLKLLLRRRPYKGGKILSEGHPQTPGPSSSSGQAPGLRPAAHPIRRRLGSRWPSVQSVAGHTYGFLTGQRGHNSLNLDFPDRPKW